MKPYISDYVLGDQTRDNRPFQKYDEQIAKFQEIKFNLIKLRDYPEQTEEMKSKIQDVINNVDHYINEFEEIRYKRYEDGIYKREWYSNGFPSEKISQFIKRVEGNSCDECAFKGMPCLGIRSHYGCYTTPEYSVNNELENGELVRVGHFIKIDPIEIKTINEEK